MYKFILLFLLSTSVYSFELPNKKLTSGDVDHERTKSVLCVPNFTAGKDDDGENVRHVPQKIKNIVFQEYGIPKEKRSDYVIDHLVSLSNGGLNNLYNLWPQPKDEGHLKDRLENKLHKMVCKGQISLEEAQNALSDNWEKSYLKYIED
jgi:hypothetical protein